MINKGTLSSLAISILALLAIGEAPSQTNFWQEVNNGLTNPNVSALAADSSGTLFAAAGFNVVFISTDSGNSWDTIGQTSGFAINSLEVSPFGYLFAGDGFNGMYRSTDNGTNWEPANNGLANPFVRALAINSSGYIFVGTLAAGIDTNFSYGIHRSTDNGNSWTQVNTGLRDSTSIGSFGIRPNGHIFAGAFDRGIYRSTNNGESWTEINNGLPGGCTVASIAISPNGHIFAGTIYSPTGTEDTVIYRSTDNGNTWTHVYIGPPMLSIVWSIATNARGDMFAAIAQSTSGYGVVRSTDDGGSWTLINSGLTTSATVYDLVFNPSGYVFAGTGGGGVFRSVESTTFVEQTDGAIPLSFSLEQNYPNPFNPSTMIQFSLPRSEFVTLKIFNMLGEQILTLVSSNLFAGTYQSQWNAQGVASGVYFYRLQAGAITQTKTLVLLR